MQVRHDPARNLALARFADRAGRLDGAGSVVEVDVTERPILFSAPMVKAILAGTKTQTRRVLKPQPPSDVTSAGVIATSREGQTDNWTWLTGDPKDCDTWEAASDFKTRFAPGDTLWVKENFIGAKGYDALPPSKWGNKPVWYCADGEPDRKLWWHLSDRKRSCLHMPRDLSRITLRVTAVKVERLQDISEADAEAEGCEEGYCVVDGIAEGWSAKSDFQRLWTSINGAASWEANPYVAAISFERVK